MHGRRDLTLEIELQGLDLDRGGRRILRGIHWRLRPGEHWLVIGGNGAGKTQLLKVLAGDVWPAPASRATRRYRWQRHWADEPLEVKDQIAYVGPERQDRYERYGWNFPAWQVVATGLHRSDLPLQPFTAPERRRSDALLARAGIAQLARRRFLTLSYGERRLVLMARALAWRPEVLLLDEVLTGLDAGHRERLQRLLSRIRSRSLIRVSTAHRREDVPAGVNRLLALEQGRTRYVGPATPARLAAAFGAERKAVAPPRRAPVARDRPGQALVCLRDAAVYFDAKPILRGVSFTLRRGECWVVHGPNGSGKSTLLRTVYGDHGVASGGSIVRAGIEPGMPLAQFRAHTGIIAPQLQTDYPRYLSVIDTVVSGLHSSIGLNEPATPGERRRALRVLARHGLAPLAQRTLGELSYGQVRRVLFARAAIVRPRLLLLDEPYAGLAGPARVALHDALEREIGDGLTVMLATHYRSEWPAGATHELELKGGQVRYAGPPRR